MNAILQAFLDAMVNDDGSGTTGDLMDKTWWTDLIGRIDTVISISGLSVETDTTFYVSPSGSDTTGDGSLTFPWETVTHALDQLRTLRITPGSTCTLQLENGAYALTESLTEMPSGLILKGKTALTRAITSVQSVNGSQGVWSLTLNIIDMTNIEVGDECAIFSASGGTEPMALYGMYPITNVDTVNSRITITTEYDETTPPSGAIMAVATIYKSRLTFTGVPGLLPSTDITVQDIALIGDRPPGIAGIADSKHGIAPNASKITLSKVGIRNFGGHGILCEQNGRVIADELTIYANAGDGINCNSSGYVEATDCCVAQNRGYGVTVENTATANVPQIVVVNNVNGIKSRYAGVVLADGARLYRSAGVDCQNGGHVKISSGTIEHGSGNGLLAFYQSFIHADSIEVTDNTGTQVSAGFGSFISVQYATLSGTDAILAAKYSFVNAYDSSVTGTVSPAVNTQDNVYAYIHKP